MFRNKPEDATPAFCELNQERLNFENILLKWDGEFNIPIHCGLFKTTIFNDLRFVEELKTAEDWVMWVDVFSRETEAVYLGAPLAYYRINPHSMTKDRTFVRTHLLETYKYLLPKLPPDYANKLISVIFDRLNDQLICHEKDLEILRGKLHIRAGQLLKNTLRKIIKRKKI